MKCNRKNTASVTGTAKAMTTGIGNHPNVFATPNPPLNTIENQTQVVETAETLARTRAQGAAAARNVQRRILVGLLEAGVMYVQQTADALPTLDAAISAIQAAGLTVALVPRYQKPILKVTHGPTPGSVALDANAKQLGAGGRRKTFFNWQYTADGGRTFVNAPPTPKSKTLLSGLTPLTSYGFRVSVTNPDGVAGEWSPLVTFIVH
jgi:hypothetical protein